jgi:integrase
VTAHVPVIVCPECGSSSYSRDGFKGDKQRFKCRVCHRRFLQPCQGQSIRTYAALEGSSRLSVILQDAKKMAPTTETKTVVVENQKINPEAQIANYLIRLSNNGRSEATIEERNHQLQRLVNRGANLNDPESVKYTIAHLDRTESYKLLLCIAYEGFAKANGISWERPKYRQGEPLPFCPHETELDALIANCGKKTATLLKLLKETGMRLGEAWQTEWMDFNPNNRTLICKNPEKHSRPRIFDNLSPELCLMLESLPRQSQYLFSCSRIPMEHEDPKTHLNHLKRQKGLLGHQRARTANKLKNPRILEVNYHSFRHWKATQLYHQTKDILYVMKFLGHRNVKNTLVYIDLEKLSYPNGGDDYTSRATKDQAEALQLIEAGFELLQIAPDGTIYFRKRK